MSYFKPTVKERVLAFVAEHQRVIVNYSTITAAIGASRPAAATAVKDLVDEGRMRVLETRRGKGGGCVFELV